MLLAAVPIVRWRRWSRSRLLRAGSSVPPGATQLKMVAVVVLRKRTGNPLIVVVVYTQLPQTDSVLEIGERLRRPAGLCAVEVRSHRVAPFVAGISNIVAGMVRGTRPGLWSFPVVLLGLWVKIKSKKSANRRIVMCV